MDRKKSYFLVIPVCLVALYFLLESAMYIPKGSNIEGTGKVLFIPIFFIICLCNIIVHIVAGIFINNQNKYINYKDAFYKKSDKLFSKVLKIVGYIFISFYISDMIVGTRIGNYYSIVWNLLAIVVTIFYLSYFSTIKINKSF